MADAAPVERTPAAKKHIRGSSLLFAGRLMSQVVTLIVQILVVRYLSQEAFGAYSYAMSVAGTIGLFSTLGFDRAISRFVPIYHEKQEYGRMFGTIKLVVLLIIGFGSLFPLSVLLFHDAIASRWVTDPQVMSLLTIAMFLVPFEAFDALIVNMFAVFASPRAIFFRRHMLAPIMRLSVAVLMVLTASGAMFLTAGMVVSVAGAVLICAYVLYRMMEEQGLWEHCNRHEVEIPLRDILAFTLPLLSTDVLFLVMNGLDVVLLEHYGNLSDVAAYRAVNPFARLNLVVYTTFTLLFTPQASRLFARNDREGINDLYWKSATWIAVLTFPVFAASFSLAKPLTPFLFGKEYSESGRILAILALGHYINASLGFNGTTLTIYRMVWWVALSTMIVAVLNVLLNLFLIPRYGAIGAAVGTTTTLIMHNIMKQAGLFFGTGVQFADRRYLRVYGIIALSAVSLWLVEHFGNLNIFVGAALGVLIFLVVVRTNRTTLAIDETFPELGRIPFIKLLLGQSAAVSGDSSPRN